MTEVLFNPTNQLEIQPYVGVTEKQARELAEKAFVNFANRLPVDEENEAIVRGFGD